MLLEHQKVMYSFNERSLDWSDTGVFLLELRKKGVVIPFTNAVIACMAIKNHLCVYSLDKHFDLVDGLVKFHV